MQITIDTQKDSPEDIRKAVAFLSSISEGKKPDSPSSNIFEAGSDAGDDAGSGSGMSAFSSMFGSTGSEQASAPGTSSGSSGPGEQETTDDGTGNTEKTDEDVPRIIEY